VRRARLRRWLAISVVLGQLVATSHRRPAVAQPQPRADHVRAALAAVRALGPGGRGRLDRALYDAARTQCRADTSAASVGCLIAVARAACAAAPDRAPCEAASDVIVTNLRSVNGFVDEATRVRLVRGSTDYHAALAAELHRRYAVLAAELVLRGAGGSTDETAAAIDELCAGRDREIHACRSIGAAGDPACVPSLPWSRCVAALVWFAGGDT
jgi:hypothetical protein